MTIKTLPNGDTESFSLHITSMVPEQPTALRLADELDAVPETGAIPDLIEEAAAELRRLAAVEAERDALKAELDRHVEALDHEMVASCIGVFNRGDDPREAINKLMFWSQGVGDYFGRQEALERVKPLTDEQIENVFDNTESSKDTPWFVRFARAIERAHGIRSSYD